MISEKSKEDFEQLVCEDIEFLLEELKTNNIMIFKYLKKYLIGIMLKKYSVIYKKIFHGYGTIENIIQYDCLYTVLKNSKNKNKKHKHEQEYEYDYRLKITTYKKKYDDIFKLVVQNSDCSNNILFCMLEDNGYYVVNNQKMFNNYSNLDDMCHDLAITSEKGFLAIHTHDELNIFFSNCHIVFYNENDFDFDHYDY